MSQLTIKNPTFAKQLEEKTKDDPIMNKFLHTIIENSYETSQFKRKIEVQITILSVIMYLY